MDLSAYPYLQGNYAPVADESDFGEGQLTIEGKIPQKLEGAFMRDGANVAYQPNHYVYPLDGGRNGARSLFQGWTCTVQKPLG